LKQIKKHRLDGSSEPPFVLIALSCHESLLKTAWNINKQLHIDLSESDILVGAKDKSLHTFPVFCDHKSSPDRYYSLISNKTSNVLLVKELPNIDFVFEISGEIKKAEISSIIKEIKGISGVVAALEIDAEKIKRKTAFCPL
jgi:hypothetical protein